MTLLASQTSTNLGAPLTRYWCFVFLGIRGNESPLQFVAPNPRGANQHDGPVNAGPRIQLSDFLVSGDLFAIEIVVLGCIIDNLFSFRFRRAMGGFRGLAAS